jgi:hypothetical protein
MRALVLACLLLSCGASTPLLVQCRLTAVSKLPLDNPDELTVGEVRALASDLKACQPRADGGV